MTPNTFIKKCAFILLMLSITSKLYSGYYEEGCKYFSYKKYDLAREMFLKNIEVSDNGNSYYFLGEIEKNEGNFDKAEEYFKLSINKNITNKYKKLAYWNIIVFEEQKGRYSEMVLICRELWEKLNDGGAKRKVESLINKFLWSDNDEAKILYNNGIEYKKKNASAKAKEAFYSALQTDPNFLAPKFELGLILFNENNADQAINYLKDITERIPFYGDVHLLLGDIYFNKQSHRNSIEYFGKALEYGFLDSKTKYSVQLKMGTSYYEMGEFEKAQEEFIMAIEINKKAVEPLLVLSAIYIKKGNFDQALATLLKAKELNQNNPEIIFQIGSLYYKMQDQKYIYFFNLLFNKFHTTKETIPQKYFKAFTLLLKEKYDNKKYEDASRIIEVIPESLKTYDINLISAKTYYYLGKHDKAIEYFEKLSLGNDDKYLLCISYAKFGMTGKAKDILWNLSNLDGYFEKAKSDNAIKKIAYEIENEKLKKEEERINAAAEEKRKIDEEKLKEEKLKEEKIKAENERLNNKKEENIRDQPNDPANVRQEIKSNPPLEENADKKTNFPDREKNVSIETSPGKQNSQ